ncbi:dolichyl-phosphate beta-glucosyltransferase [Streptomyces nanshensis]|uniref:dolichyl-phosphate beta-glucosyltransferase n=1 Tax=Streptomyces nanshensis TaxID=518642 RepID=A0A1E7L5X1_9ACTN|nr:dolichyl-phosphate beta-glucosyltransferase [Streptomyces nanshensis]OEV11564.1 glycosyl transferase [Streptomyces nanshensis]
MPARSPLAVPRTEPAPTVLDVVVPVHNEEGCLEASVRRLHAYLTGHFPYGFRITVADNASTDGTYRIATRLALELGDVVALHLERKGRGRALHTVWSRSDAPVRAYLDVDLSTDLNALLPLVAPLISGHSDIAIGSRLAGGARVVRGPKRELISRSYNLLLRGSLLTRFSDAQCGFKAVRGDVAERLLPLVQDAEWFFDTELLVLAERAGMRIHEVPVDWVDDPDSRVDLLPTALADLRGVWRVGRALATGALPLARLRRPFGDDPRDHALRGVPRGLARQLAGFCVVGLLSTLAYLLLYSLLRQVLGAQSANALALLLTALGNTAANRRHTFRVRGRTGVVRHQAQGLLVFAIGLTLTSGSLAALEAAAPDPPHSTEIAVLVVANLAATLLRFLLFRTWIFAGEDGNGGPAPGEDAGRATGQGPRPAAGRHTGEESPETHDGPRTDSIPDDHTPTERTTA